MLGFVDTTLLWLNLGISLLVLVLPAYFDLSLKDALAATLVGGVIGNGMLALAALIRRTGAHDILQRAPLGRQGSYLATVLNVMQCMGWAIFELIVIATAAGLLCDQLFGFEAVWAWKLAFGGVAAGLALMGPIGFVRRFVRKFAIWAVAASVVYLGWWILDGAAVGTSGRPTESTTGRSGSRRHGDRHRLLGSARRRLHPLLEGPAKRVLRRFYLGYLLPRSSSSGSARSSFSRAASSRAIPS